MDVPAPVAPGSNGRGPGGRFAPGNRLAQGNLVNRRMYYLRARLLSAISPAAIEAAGRQLCAQAEAGDLAAIRVLLDYAVGRPPQAVALSGPDGEPLGTDWGRVQAALTEALAPFAEARVAVALKLRGLVDDRGAEPAGDGP